jgi:hypothetical protein
MNEAGRAIPSRVRRASASSSDHDRRDGGHDDRETGDEIVPGE